MKHKILFIASLRFLSLMTIVSEAVDQDISPLIMQLGSADASVRRNAALAIGKLGKIGESAKDAVSALIKTLNDKEWTVRVSAANALGDIGKAAKDAVPALIPALIKALSDENWQVRYWTVDALGRIGEAANDAVPALAKALSDKDYRVRLSAADVLGNIGKPAKDAVPELIKALSDTDHRVRANIALALGKIGEAAKDAIPELTKVLKDEDSQVRENAAVALRQISIPTSIMPGAEVRLETPKTGSYILVYVPEDYTPDRAWPIIFCYHGYNGKATTWPFTEATHGRGFIIAGMEYATKEYALHLGMNRVGPEITQFDEALAMASSFLKVNPNVIFIGGFSQGGYSTSILGEQLLDRLAGLIILGAGRSAADRYPPPTKSLQRKPIFIGVGENDTVHHPRAKDAARIYKLWGADVTLEEWPGVGHAFDGTKSKLLDWLLAKSSSRLKQSSK